MEVVWGETVKAAAAMWLDLGDKSAPTFSRCVLPTGGLMGLALPYPCQTRSWITVLGKDAIFRASPFSRFIPSRPPSTALTVAPQHITAARFHVNPAATQVSPTQRYSGTTRCLLPQNGQHGAPRRPVGQREVRRPRAAPLTQARRPRQMRLPARPDLRSWLPARSFTSHRLPLPAPARPSLLSAR